MVETLAKIQGYRPYFKQAFGTQDVTKERVAHAVADYERTRMDGNSPWDRWRQARDQNAVSDEVKRGHELFFGKAKCNQCHLGQNFTDNRFHNLGVGYNPRTRKYKDEGRFAVTKNPDDLGAFKTPTLRDVTKHAPYMHDGSVTTLRQVMDLYNRGGDRNPHLDPKVGDRLHLDDSEIDALIAFMKALEGEGYQDVPPTRFPE
jgi:cytochrome c peroxidase